MMSDQPESRIHLLNNWISPRQKAKLGAQNCTIDEAHVIAAEVAEFYMTQVPKMVLEVLEKVLAGQGVTMKPPAPESDE